MKALSLFSGIGGIDLAGEWAGIDTVAFCEREPFCQKVLQKHWPDTPIYDDVCTLTKERLEADGIGTIELIHGGYPCQPFSNAGNRKGTEDDRHLWPEVFRLIQAIQPRWFVGENVAGHVSLGLDIVLADLESIGYTWEAFVIPAVAVDARHRRDRIFIVGYSQYDGSSLAAIRRSISEAGDYLKKGAETSGELEGTSGQPYFELMGDNTKTDGSNSPSTRLEGKQWKKSKGSRIRLANSSERNGWNKWAAEPNVGRVANGVPDRVDRIKALGNSVVPQQIYPILAAIKQIDDIIQEVSP